MSKIKLIVEIEKRTYELLKDKPDNTAEAIIANGTPYNPQGDAISREALRKAIEEVEDNYDGYEPNDLGKFMCKVDDLIDNAPPVEVYTKDDMAGAYNEGYVCGNKEAGKARPQGKWKTNEGYDGDEYYECSNCGEPWFLSAGTPKDNNMNFCPNCGAEMKGGVE